MWNDSFDKKRGRHDNERTELRLRDPFYKEKKPYRKVFREGNTHIPKLLLRVPSSVLSSWLATRANVVE